MKTHGLSRTPEFSSWRSMMKRCYYPKTRSYHCYGGRGIKVCKRWHKFENFLADMGKRPKGKSLGRIDHDKNYFQKNCTWATAKEQAQGRRFYRWGNTKGVYRGHGLFRAVIYFRGEPGQRPVRKHLGYYKTFAEARRVYLSARAEAGV